MEIHYAFMSGNKVRDILSSFGFLPLSSRSVVEHRHFCGGKKLSSSFSFYKETMKSLKKETGGENQEKFQSIFKNFKVDLNFQMNSASLAQKLILIVLWQQPAKKGSEEDFYLLFLLFYLQPKLKV